MQTNWKFVDMLLQIRRLKAAKALESAEVFLPDGSGRIVIVPPYKKVVTSSVTQRPIPKEYNEWEKLGRV